MYEIKNNQSPFGIEGYDPEKKYLDPNAQMKQRELELNKKKG